jgi:hypothetical protein
MLIMPISKCTKPITGTANIMTSQMPAPAVKGTTDEKAK